MTVPASLAARGASPAGRALLAGHGQVSLGSHITAWVVLALIVAVVAGGVAAVVSPRWRRTAPRVIAWLLGGLLAAYLVGRGVAEFFTVNFSSPASYRDDWGGPSLAGVFAVHSGPGAVVVIAAAVWLWRRHRARALAGADGGAGHGRRRRPGSRPLAGADGGAGRGR
jgi:hypothetical protein